MRINFYSTFREHAGVKSIVLEPPSITTVRKLIDILLQDYPTLRRLWLDQNGELHAHVQISLNQVDVMALPDQMETKIKEDDVLDFYPPITGG